MASEGLGCGEIAAECLRFRVRRVLASGAPALRGGGGLCLITLFLCVGDQIVCALRITGMFMHLLHFWPVSDQSANHGFTVFM